jgi:copper(I)-binding protein
LSLAGRSLIFAGSVQPQSSSIAVHDAWVREPLANRNETAAFAVVENSSAELRSIVRVETNAAEKAELHEMKMTGAMMRMSPVEKIEVPAHGKTELKPGGLHIMLFGLRKPAIQGEKIELKLTLDDGSSIAVSAEVRKPEAPR